MRQILAVVMLLCFSGFANAAEPLGHRAEPNPLLKTPDRKFLPVAKEIMRQDAIGVVRPVKKGGVSSAYVVFVDRSDAQLKKELTEEKDQVEGIGGYRTHQSLCLQDVENALSKVAADNKAAKDKNGVWRSDSTFYEPFATDPRLYERAVKLVGKPSVATEKKSSVENATDNAKGINRFLKTITGTPQ